MYRRPKFLELLLEIRREMALEADYDVDLFVGLVRKESAQVHGKVMTEAQSVEPIKTEADIPTNPKRREKVREG